MGRKDMRKNIILEKSVVCGLLLILLSSTVVSTSGCRISTAQTTESLIEEGTLSGYVTDSEMHPVEGARIRVYFHETYRENYSDSTGHYRVNDIPICYCSKNATCAKEGYKTEWVWLSIYENTTYDFVLTPCEGYSYPEFNSTLGTNGWYVRPVIVTFVGDLNDTMYRINNSGWIEYTNPFILNSQGIHVLEWRCNSSATYSVEIKIDWLPPNVTNFSHKRLGLFKWQFAVDVSDEFSGVKSVQFDIDLSIDSEPPYQLIWRGCFLLYLIRCFISPSFAFMHMWDAWDNAGNHYNWDPS
jgi:hypothetical protein